MLARIRKAVVAGLGGGIAPAAAVLAKATAIDRATVGQALGAFLVGAAALGWATWRVPNSKAAGGFVVGSPEYWDKLGHNPDGTPRA